MCVLGPHANINVIEIMTELVPPLPDDVPKRGGRISQWIGRAALRMIGWRVAGDLPNLKHVVICAAPHTSNWDFIVAMAVVKAMGIKFSYLMKKEAFIWPFRRWFMSMGGIPLDRSAAEDTVEQIDQWFQTHEHVWLAITPEGTRSKVDKWKTGFLRIAYQAKVPVLLVAWHYPHKTLYLDRVWELSGDIEKDEAEIRSYMLDKFEGAHPQKQ